MFEIDIIVIVLYIKVDDFKYCLCSELNVREYVISDELYVVLMFIDVLDIENM